MTDRLALIKARHAEAGGGNGDLLWLIAEVERQRRHREWAIKEARMNALRYWNTLSAAEQEIERLSGPPAFLDEALNSGRGEYKP